MTQPAIARVARMSAAPLLLISPERQAMELAHARISAASARVEQLIGGPSWTLILSHWLAMQGH